MSKPSRSASSRSFSACSISFSASKDSRIPSALRAGFGVLTVAWLEVDSSLLIILRDALALRVRAARCDVGLSNALGPTNASTHMSSAHRLHSSIRHGLMLVTSIANASQEKSSNLKFAIPPGKSLAVAVFMNAPPSATWAVGGVMVIFAVVISCFLNSQNRDLLLINSGTALAAALVKLGLICGSGIYISDYVIVQYAIWSRNVNAAQRQKVHTLVAQNEELKAQLRRVNALSSSGSVRELYIHEASAVI
jgi:hypothetical protein